MSEIKTEFIKLNDEPIMIEYVEDERPLYYDPSFWFRGCRYYLRDFVRCNNNPWFSVRYPEYIAGELFANYFNPYFIEVIDGEAINVYVEKEVES